MHGKKKIFKPKIFLIISKNPEECGTVLWKMKWSNIQETTVIFCSSEPIKAKERDSFENEIFTVANVS